MTWLDFDKYTPVLRSDSLDDSIKDDAYFVPCVLYSNLQH